MKKNLTVSLLAAAAISAPLSAQFMSSLNPAIDLNTFGIVQDTGIVIEILGTNGAHVVAQLSALELYNGFFDYGTGGGDIINGVFGYAGGANTPIPGVADALGIIGESYGWDAFDFGGGIAGINIEMTMFDFQGFNNPGDDLLMVNDLDYNFGFDLGLICGPPAASVGTAEFLGCGPYYDAILADLTSSGILNISMFETFPDVYTYGGYTPVDFLTDIKPSKPVRPTQVTAPIPEPSFIALISFGFIATLLGTSRRRR
jgi:hypothetical protein|tara:strand:- start:13686 stop:14459 length:774 start_codon:yes stop_codon:yes gene_type:complete